MQELQRVTSQHPNRTPLRWGGRDEPGTQEPSRAAASTRNAPVLPARGGASRPPGWPRCRCGCSANRDAPTRALPGTPTTGCGPQPRSRRSAHQMGELKAGRQDWSGESVFAGGDGREEMARPVRRRSGGHRRRGRRCGRGRTPGIMSDLGAPSGRAGGSGGSISTTSRSPRHRFGPGHKRRGGGEKERGGRGEKKEIMRGSAQKPPPPPSSGHRCSTGCGPACVPPATGSAAGAVDGTITEAERAGLADELAMRVVEGWTSTRGACPE